MAIKKIYVGNLSFQIEEEDLKEYFEQAGDVKSVKIVKDKDTNQSRGFAFIEMEEEDIDKAISMFDGQNFAGRQLVVKEARENR